jgi:hypothetical protein
LPRESRFQRSLKVVVLDEGLSGSTRLLHVGRPIQSEALLLIAAIVAFHEGVLLWVMRSTNVDVNAQTGSQANQSRRKITACWTADRALDHDPR